MPYPLEFYPNEINSTQTNPLKNCKLYKIYVKKLRNTIRSLLYKQFTIYKCNRRQNKQIKSRTIHYYAK